MPGKLTDSAIRGAKLVESLQVDGGRPLAGSCPSEDSGFSFPLCFFFAICKAADVPQYKNIPLYL